MCATGTVRLLTSICLGTSMIPLLARPKVLALFESTMVRAAPVSTANQAGRSLTRTETKRWLPVLRLRLTPEVNSAGSLAFKLGRRRKAQQPDKLAQQIRSFLNRCIGAVMN